MTRHTRNTILNLTILTVVIILLCSFFIFMKKNAEATPVSATISYEENTLYLYGFFPARQSETDAISWWYCKEDGFYYFFLPEDAKGKEVHVAFDFSGADSLIWGATSYQSGDIVAELCEGAIAVIIGDTSYPVKVIYGDSIPTMMIKTASHSMDDVDAALGIKEAGTILVSDRNSSYFYDGDLSYIRGRGNSSFGYDKKSYQIHFPDKTGLCGMDKAKNWVLLPQYFDHTGLRNGLTFELAKELQIAFTPNYRLVNLYLNGTYHGLYLATDKIEVSQARVNIRDLDEFYHTSDEVNIENIPTFGEPEYIKNTCKGFALSCTPDDLTGGYLLELELPERYEQAGDCGFVTSRGQAVIIKSPSYATEEEVHYIRDWYQEFEDAVYANDGINPNTGKHYTDYIDLKSVAAKYLLEEWIKNPDAGKTSQFFYKPADSMSTLMYAGPVWDYDIAYGDLVAFSHPEGLWASYLDQECNLYTALCAHNDFMKEVLSQYETVVLPFYQNKVTDYIRTQSDASQQSAYMSVIRWNAYQTTEYADFLTRYQADLSAISSFLGKRSDYLNAVWLNNISTHDVYVDISECDSFYLGTDNHVSVLDGQCIYFLYPPVKYGYLFDHWINKKTGEEFKLATPVTEDNIILQPVFIAE